MSQLPNPNQGKPYDRVIKDAQGNEIYGIRGEHTDNEEIVDVRTGRSNMAYWQPEMVLNPEGCQHHFFISDIGHREVECTRCKLATTFHPGINFREENGLPEFQFRGQWYPLH